MSGRVYSPEELKELYGSFYELGARQELSMLNVPGTLAMLMHYAAFWGISDDKRRDSLVQVAPLAARLNLKAVVNAHEDLLDAWLAGEEADDPSPTPEYVAFSAMRMAADFA